MPPSNRRRRGRRATATAAATAGLVVALAGPALAHASFPQSTNPAGSPATPLPAGTAQTLKMAVPFEQDGVQFNGLDNTVVNVKITAPTGWTKAGCGEARKTDLSAVVSGWTCTVTADGDRQVLQWTGAQVTTGKSADDSAQYFTFTVTTPRPTAATGYGAAGSAADGFRVVQRYADGATATWRTPGDTGTGEVANGLVRTVAASTGATPAPASPTPKVTAAATPTPTRTATSSSSGGQTITGTVLPKTGGESVSGPWLLATSGVLAVGLVLVASTTRTRRRSEEN